MASIRDWFRPRPREKQDRARKMARVQWGIGLGIALLVLVLSRMGALERLEYPLLDFNARNFTAFSPPPASKLVMVAIDDQSITSVGKWPWPRELMAGVIRELHRAGAGVIALDLLLDDPQAPRIEGDVRDPASLRLVDGDAELAAAIREHGKVVLGGSFNIHLRGAAQKEEGRLKSVPLADVIREIVARPGISDEDLQSKLLPSDQAGRAAGAIVEDLRLKARQARLLMEREDVFTAPVPADDRPWAASREPDPPAPVLLEAASRLATVSFGSTDSDGAVRRIPMWVRQEGRLYPTLGLAGAALLLGVEPKNLRVEGTDTVMRLPSGEELRLRMHRGVLDRIGKVAALYYVTWPKGGGWGEQFVDADLLARYEAQRERRPDAKVDVAGLGLPALSPEKTGCARTEIDVRRDTTADIPPGMDLPIGKLLDPYLASLRIKQNLRENSEKILALAAMGHMADVGLVSDPKAFAERSRRLQAEDFESEAWKAAYAEHLRSILEAMDNANFYLEGLKASFAEGAALPEKESLQREALCAFVHAMTTMLAEIDVRLEDIKTLRESVRRRVEGKLCLVGWTGTGAIADFVQTSIDARTPGVYVHGAMANSVFTQYARQVTGLRALWSGLIALALMGAVGTWVGVRMGVVVGPLLLVAACAACVYLMGMFVWDRAGQVASFGAPLVAAVLSWSGVMLHRLLVEQRGRKQTEARFRSYVSPDVVDILVNNPDLQSMAPQRRELTIMFSDVANWTTLTERLGTEGIFKFLSKYLGEMTDIIQKNKATLDKYLGDGIMAFWGAPIEDPDHAKNAQKACVDMLKRLAEMNRNGEFGDAGAIEVRFGIACGEVNVGDFGNPPHKSAYTVIGDAVNLAARLESSNKQFGTSILMTKRVVDLSGSTLLFRPIGRIVVKGKTEYEELYELIGDRQPKSERTDEWVEVTRRSVEAYQRGDLDEAEAGFHRMADEFDDGKLAKLYLHAIEELRAGGVPEGWEGTLTLTEK